MGVAKTQGISASCGTLADLSSSSAQGLRGSSWTNYGTPSQSQPVESAEAVIDNIDYAVYSAIQDFAERSGDARFSSYSQLSDAGKDKFMKVLGKMASGGELSSEQLDLGEATPATQAFLSDYARSSSNTASIYGDSGKPLS